MYQPRPAGAQPPVPAQPPRPVLNAVRLMYVGAALEIIGLILNLADLGSAHTNSSTQIAGTVIGAALWLWMAVMNKAGKNWARIIGTILFGIDCLFLIGLAILVLGASAMTGLVALVVIAAVVTWLIGLGAVVLLWQRESSAYFQAMSGG